MTESTFLSRSFGDQGVRLRIRKEPRTLLYANLLLDPRPSLHSRRKRQYPTARQSRHTVYQPGYPAPIPQDLVQHPPYSGAVDYPEHLAKRQRASFGTTGRDPYEQEQRAFTYATPYYPAFSQGQSLIPGPQSTSGPYSDYSFGHQRTNSSAASSPYVSPLETSGYHLGPSHLYGQYQTRDPICSYQPPYHDLQQRYTPQLAYPVPPARQGLMPSTVKIEAPVATSQSASRALTSLAQAHVYQSAPRPTMAEEAMEPSTESPLRASDRPILPPLQSTLQPTQTQGTAPQLHSSNVLPRIGSHGSGHVGAQGYSYGHSDNTEVHPPYVPSTS